MDAQIEMEISSKRSTDQYNIITAQRSVELMNLDLGVELEHGIDRSTCEMETEK